MHVNMYVKDIFSSQSNYIKKYSVKFQSIWTSVLISMHRTPVIIIKLNINIRNVNLPRVMLSWQRCMVTPGFTS